MKLPAQNVLVIVGGIFSGEIFLEWIWHGGGVAWRPGLFWLAVVLAARSFAKWGLRARRANANYGFLLIGLAAVVTSTVQLILAQDLHGAVIRFVWTCVTLVALMPWFIDKRPASNAA